MEYLTRQKIIASKKLDKNGEKIYCYPPIGCTFKTVPEYGYDVSIGSEVCMECEFFIREEPTEDIRINKVFCKNKNNIADMS